MCVCNLDQYGKIETITHIIIIFTFVSTYTFIVLFFCFWFIYATLITKTYVSGLYCLTWVDYYITIIHLGYTPHHMDLILYVCLRVFICGNWRGNGSGSGSGSGYLSGYIFRYAVIIIYRVIGSNECTRKEGGILQNYTHTHTQIEKAPHGSINIHADHSHYRHHYPTIISITITIFFLLSIVSKGMKKIK